MTPTGHVNQAAERAFWKGPATLDRDCARALADAGYMPLPHYVAFASPSSAGDAARPDRVELPSAGSAGDVRRGEG